MQTHRRRPSKSILLPRVSGASLNVYQHGCNIRPIYARRAQAHLSESTPDNTYLWGYVLLGGSAFLFFSTLYAIVGSKFMPDTGIKVLDWIKHDKYYCLLVPITGIMWIYFIIWNWMGMKFFRHN